MIPTIQHLPHSSYSTHFGRSDCPPNFLNRAWMTGRHLLLSPLTVCLPLILSAQVPNTLLHSIPAPPVGVQTGAGLGRSVAVDGDYTVVGAPNDDYGGTNSGVVKVFDSSTGALLFLLANPSPALTDNFGYSVAVSGTLVVVGAYQDDTGATNAGSAYVYDLSSSTPTAPVVTLNNPDPAPSDWFGILVAISGTRVVVGAYQDDTGANDAGSAYVYDLSRSTPTVPVAILNNPSPNILDYFGSAIAISGTRVVVGARADDTVTTDAGSAYVYDLSSSTPTVPVITLNNPGAGSGSGDWFGYSVTISGTRVVVGNRALFVAESAYVYDLSSGTPTVPLFTLTNPTSNLDERFAFSVAISGTRVVVGAYQDDTGATEAGSAYVYDLGSGTPSVPVATLNNPSPAVQDYFGSSVAISGTQVVVGAYRDDTGGADAGSAYIYDVDSGTPTVPLVTLNSPGPALDDRFGTSVAISGNLMVVGADQDDTGSSDAGSAYVYDLSSSTPTVPVLTLNNPNPWSQDYFGYAVAISGTRVVVGAYQDGSPVLDAGSAYVYDLSSSTPTVPVITLHNPSPNRFDSFGYAVAISGTKVVVGAYLDDTGFFDAGIAYVYDLTGGTPSVPVVTFNNPGPLGNSNYGYSVAISGARVVIGAYQNDTGAFGAGSAYVYDLSSGTPTVPVTTLYNPSPAVDDWFGYSVAVSGTRVVVGAYRDDSGALNAGSAYVYDLSSGSPTEPVATLNNPSPAAGDCFGYSVTISGTRVVVGAYLDDTGATDAGSTYVYDLSSGTPTTPISTLNNPGPAAQDYFGYSVAADGTMIAIGTPLDDTVTFNKGFAYVFGPLPLPDISVAQAGPLTDGSGSIPFTTTLGNSSEPLTFTITNPSRANLTGLSVAKHGANSAEFSVSALSGTSIPVGTDSVTFTVTFSPSSTGPKTAALRISSNVIGSKNPFDIQLTGTSLPSSDANLSGLSLSGVTLSPDFAADTLSYTSAEVPNMITALTVSPVKANAFAVVQVRVNGGSYSLPSSLLALNVGSNTIDVRVTSQDGTTTKTYTVTVPRSEGPEIAISGNGVGIFDGDTTPHGADHTDFGFLSAESGMRTRTFTLANTGALALNLSGTPKVQISGAHASDFQVSLMPGSPVAASDSTTFEITFDPSSVGLRSAVVSIDSDDADESPYTFAISGTGRIASQAVQRIVFEAPQKLHLAESPFTLSASSSSGLPVVFTVLSGPANVSGNVLTLTGVGAVKVRASQPGDTDFLAAASVERTITVIANPTTLTLTNLSQTYTGTPREITVLGATGEVDVTYKVGLSYVSTAPTNAGSYPVKAVAGAVSKTGKLTITKAPLFVTPDDQRKFAGQANPVLTFGYGGFLGSDNAVKSVSKAPVISTKATATSAGGLYPITGSGGASDNYLFVYQSGTMIVETFAASYEALLVDEDTQRPAAKLELTVAASSKTFSAKLTTPTETAAVGLSGTLSINPLTETATGTATVKKGTNTYLVTVTLPLTGDFTAEARQNGTLLGDPTDGRKLLTLAKGQTLSYAGAHSALLAPAQPAAVGVPAGAGWAVATIDAKGLLKLVGKLADGTGLTASLAADVDSNPGYRLFSQPYTPARTEAFIAGDFALKEHLDTGLTGRRYVAFEDEADLVWVKSSRQKDPSYRAGFGPVSTRFTLDPWLPPTPAKGSTAAITLKQLFGLSDPANEFTVQHSDISSSSFGDLPTTLALNPTSNAVSVIAPANTTKWKVSITPKTGAFVGSFELDDSGKKRLVPFAGMMRQPPSTDLSGLIGDGSFQLPSLSPAPNNEVLSGEVGFER